ncbi:serine threonine kinase sporulation specific [Cryptosporidium xiaoi]|uniref:Serine threonine kinase sporulation specific n=1 Tax=Cryptosporidium xiaoi TaxID=659607 RepID=A0AAV9XV38_9CRYT
MENKGEDSLKTGRILPTSPRKVSECYENALFVSRRQKLTETFKIGNSIEIFNNSSCERYSNGGKNTESGDKGESSNSITDCRERDLIFRFGILEHLGVGSYGIVVLANSTVVRSGDDLDSNIDEEAKTKLLNGRKKSSIKAEVSEFHIRKLIEIGENERNKRQPNNLVAIKIMDLEEKDSLIEEDPIVFARREIKIMSELQDCDKILRYYVTFTSGSYLFIIMEYCKGGSLYGIYNKYGSFPEELIALVMIDVIKALKRLHYGNESEYIMHNDIKSANILISDKCEAKLADFGVSRKVYLDGREERMQNGILYDFNDNGKEMLGSPFWMAPEVILGLNYTYSADIWSLGITVLELAFGRIPWPKFSRLDDLLAHILKSPPPHKNIREDIKKLFSQEFWNFVDSCLQVDPLKRANSTSLLMHPFLQNKHFVQPANLEEFRNILSGKRIIQYHNMVGSPYIEEIFGYLNDIFSDKNKILPTNISNIRSKKSISLSRYFSRKNSKNNEDRNNKGKESTSVDKKSDETKIQFGISPLNNEEGAISTHNNINNDNSNNAYIKNNSISKGVSESQTYFSPNHILERRISAKYVQECIVSSPFLENSVKLHSLEIIKIGERKEEYPKNKDENRKSVSENTSARYETESYTNKEHHTDQSVNKKKASRTFLCMCTCIKAATDGRHKSVLQ